jgi:hypothetical protein
MSGEKAAVVDVTTKGAGQRQRSTIGFPYMDLGAAMEMADAIHSHAGLGDCDDDQLAAWTDQSAKASTFRVQVYAARMFGILDVEGGKHKLSELGRAVVDPNQAREAKARAFLTVPLHKAIFEKYRGGILPPSSALERDIVALGVSEKQKGRARQVFERSAELAGFFEHGKNRLVAPAVAAGRETPREELKTDQENNGNGGNGGGKPPEIDPIIRGLLARLPKSGDLWPKAQRKLWLQLLEVRQRVGPLSVAATMQQRHRMRALDREGQRRRWGQELLTRPLRGGPAKSARMCRFFRT